ncbi:hypothetical protein ACXHQ9_09135 [Vibrio cincinnatiensis]
MDPMSLMSLGGGFDTGGGAITPSSSSSAKNGDMYASGPTIQGLSMGTAAASGNNMNYMLLAVILVIGFVVLWRK